MKTTDSVTTPSQKVTSKPTPNSKIDKILKNYKCTCGTIPCMAFPTCELTSAVNKLYWKSKYRKNSTIKCLEVEKDDSSAHYWIWKGDYFTEQGMNMGKAWEQIPMWIVVEKNLKFSCKELL